MKVMTAVDAKNNFGSFIDAAQREPVIVTKKNRPVGIFLSLQDLEGTTWQDQALELLSGSTEPKEAGYDTWYKAKVTRAMERAKSGAAKSSPHDEVFARIEAKLRSRFPDFVA